MASDSRTLKLAILGEVKGLSDSLKTSSTEVESFGDKVENFGRKAGLAFAAATAAAALYAGKLLKEGVESAIADEKAQASLAKTLENVTGATKNQIGSVEDYILKTSLATGVTDDQLRPSLDRLVRSTKDVKEAQDLQALALDISAGSGKSLAAVSEALAKATDGNTGALGRLGVGLDKSEIKTMSMNEITKKLSETFGGQASQKAETFQGKMDRLKVALDEAKESVGTALLPVLERLVGFITDSILPKINAFVAGLTGNKGARDALDNTGQAAYDLGKAFSDMAVSVGHLFKVFNADENTGSSSGLAKVIGWAENVIKVFDKLIQGLAYTMGLIKVISNPKNWLLNADETVALANQYAGIATKSAPGTTVNRSSTPMNITFPTGGTGSGGGGTSGGGTSGGGSSISNAIGSAVANALPKNIQYQPLPQLSASEALFSSLTGTSGDFPGTKVSPFLAQSPNISITVNGAVDATSTARQIAGILNTEATVSGAFLELGQSRLLK
ncbi:hypothetical protein UFOVP981_21 [uncultured Caudovirales phage]|uniref:Uncharacterized protein n=1 Tax=uncultured Caudovirales phage TaxID=2100421 RepID=A0A6J5T5G1_9CAUD|nr:hypothetical protein UFOVP981_21 [uncultured Caudovirales phage]CAB4222456.1 hypothetical protein UFOVP1652_7 [uncultured Caudovirales phage]